MWTPFAGTNQIRFRGSAGEPHSQRRSALPCPIFVLVAGCYTRPDALTTVGTVSSFSQFRDVVVGIWMPLTVALNMINRSMGHDDLYPFVIPEGVLDKLDFVAALAKVG